MNVKNSDGKTVCRVDEDTQEVIIWKRNCQTVISFDENGKAQIKNTKKKEN